MTLDSVHHYIKIIHPYTDVDPDGSCMGLHDAGARNDKGDRFANIYSGNGLVIGGTVSQHKTTDKLTWTSPGRRTSNKIYNIAAETQKN